MVCDLTSPFVLLDDADGTARLYRAPVRVIEARTPGEVSAALTAIRQGVAQGLHAAGYLAYEAGTGIEPRIASIAGEGLLLWFGLFESFEDVADVAAILPDPAGALACPPTPTISRDDYHSRLARVLKLIAAGDIYQANLTFPATVAFQGSPLALYAKLRGQARARYGAIVSTGTATLLSFSPELLFRLDGDRLLARPMKGTAARGITPQADAQAIVQLRDDPKQRAENLMIVDLLRNDLTRIAAPGSVAVPALFTVESYPTVHQMVSDVTATLADGNDAVDVLEALFPCGSITGAPKIRASEIIAEVEHAARGAYTGSIGRIEPGGDALFNVAIRTLTVQPGAQSATMGLGSGIVADSVAADEWDECHAKGAFVTAGQRRPDLIETMAFDPESGIALLERHLARLKASAEAFGFPFDRHNVRNELQAATFRLRSARKIRLLLAPSGAIAIEVAPLPPPFPGEIEVAVVRLPVAREDFRLRHKTTDRAFYDAARIAAGSAEVLFTLPDGRLTEGSFTSLFVERGGLLVTPPASLGLLPGILRAELLASGRAIESELTRADLYSPFFVGNALRGLVRAVAVA